MQGRGLTDDRERDAGQGGLAVKLPNQHGGLGRRQAVEGSGLTDDGDRCDGQDRLAAKFLD